MKPARRVPAAFLIGATATGVILVLTNANSSEVAGSSSESHPATQHTASVPSPAPSSSPPRTETRPPAQAPPAPQDVAAVATDAEQASQAQARLEADAASSVPAPVEVATDDHVHAHIEPHDETVAATVAVAISTWRFDDDSDRLKHTIASAGSNAVVDSLIPSSIELARRQAVREVSWAIVVEHTVAGARHELVVQRRSFSDEEPETAETRHLTLMVFAGKVASVVEHPAETS